MGRIALLEFLEMTPPLRALVASGAGEAALRQRAQEAGLVPLLRNGLEKARRGVTAVPEVLEACAAD
jgi:type II secretory ATPase GspE/PulE/Tfp pilus assembly ATPase PilB-like protein